MRISAKVIADSVGSNGVRLVTMELNYPRFIHAEFMTHRVFSRNASSSRALPVAKQIDMIEQYYARPIEWGQNKPGMQAGEEIDSKTRVAAEDEWALAVQDAVKHARKLKDLGVHKQVTNRILEPFAFIRVIVTATEWDNFFALRISPLAQPEIRCLAENMQRAIQMSVPQYLTIQDYHAPYLKTGEIHTLDMQTAMMASAARCARVSYLTHDGLEPDLDKDLNLAERLYTDQHSSVFEHQATPMRVEEPINPVFNPHIEWCRNFRGWNQHRALLGL